MTNKQTPAQSAYESAVEKLRKFCKDYTDLTPVITDSEYPIRVTFFPNSQLSLFGDENVDETGEVNDLTVVVGLSTAVKSTLRFKMDSKLLKKLIKLAEKVGSLYYHAFREEQEERITPQSPIQQEKGKDRVLCCPNCGAPVKLWEAAFFCQVCGQALDCTQEVETEATEE